ACLVVLSQPDLGNDSDVTSYRCGDGQRKDVLLQGVEVVGDLDFVRGGGAECNGLTGLELGDPCIGGRELGREAAQRGARVVAVDVDDQIHVAGAVVDVERASIGHLRYDRVRGR